jgi:hypothetical protein
MKKMAKAAFWMSFHGHILCGFLDEFSWSYAAFWMSFHGHMRLSVFITYCIKEEVLESTILTVFYVSIQGDSQRKQI